jgi:malate synthase
VRARVVGVGMWCDWRVGSREAPSGVLLLHNNLHFEIAIDRANKIGRLHPAGVTDVILEAALTTIQVCDQLRGLPLSVLRKQDCEDSVAAVDAIDKARVYRNWNGIMKGTAHT